jgi:hypothetical protein
MLSVRPGSDCTCGTLILHGRTLRLLSISRLILLRRDIAIHFLGRLQKEKFLVDLLSIVKESKDSEILGGKKQ